MNVDAILETMNRHKVAYLLIGGMNFLLRHQPVMTYDVDLWIEDSPENRGQCVKALEDLQATWGETEDRWRSIREFEGDWLERHGVFCLLTDAGPVDIFRSVRGLPDWRTCAARAVSARTPVGTAYLGLSDEDMLACQLALDEPLRKLDRIRSLKDVVSRRTSDGSG